MTTGRCGPTTISVALAQRVACTSTTELASWLAVAPPNGENFAYVIHDCIAVHGVSAAATLTGTGNGAVAGRGDPVHLLTGTACNTVPPDCANEQARL